MDDVVAQDETIGDGGTSHDTKARQCADLDRAGEQQEDGGHFTAPREDTEPLADADRLE